MTDKSDKANQVIAHANAVFTRLDERKGAVRDAARRERQRLNSDLFTRVKRALVVLVAISLVTIGIGLDTPIGLFGFLGAAALAIVAAGVLLAMPTRTRSIAAPSTDLPNGEMVQRFDSYLYRARKALPAPAQAQIDALSAELPALRQTLERVETLDPNAQDARRLMSLHLPGLIDRYMHVPTAYRGERDGEGKSADERLVESLAAGRAALKDISENFARTDLAALEAQGRFIQSRYGSDTPALPVPDKDGAGATADS